MVSKKFHAKLKLVYATKLYGSSLCSVNFEYFLAQSGSHQDTSKRSSANTKACSKDDHDENTDTSGVAEDSDIKVYRNYGTSYEGCGKGNGTYEQEYESPAAYANHAWIRKTGMDPPTIFPTITLNAPPQKNAALV